MLTTYSSKQQPNRIIIYSALAALLLVGLWLRLRFIHTVNLFPDEFVTLLAVQMIGEKGVPIMPSGLFYEHGLLFSYVGSLAALIGPARLAVRYASLIFGLLTLASTYFIGRRWFSPAVGLIATAGLVIAPAAIHWSGRARMYALLQLLVLLTLWLAYEGIVAQNARWRWAALLTYLGATLAHFAAVALAPPLVLASLILLWLQTTADRQAGKPAGEKLPWRVVLQPKFLLEAVALVGILVVAFLVKRAGQPKGVEALEPTNALPGLAQVLVIYSDFSFNLVEGWQAVAPFFYNLPGLIYVPFALVALIASFVTFGHLFNGESRQGPAATPTLLLLHTPALFLSVILLTTTLEMVLLVSPDRRDDKYLFMLLPVLLLLGGQGMIIVGRLLLAVSRQLFAFKSSARRPSISNLQSLLSIVCPLLISGLILTITQSSVSALLTNTGDDYDSAFAYVQSHWQPGDKILTGTPAAAALYLGHNDFYSVQRRGGYDYRILTVDDQPVDRWLASPAIRTKAALHKTLAENRVWLVLERWGLQREYYDLPFQQQLLAQTDYIGEAQGIFILRSKPDPKPLALDPTHTMEAVFGDQVRLTGYTIEPERPEPGQTLRLTLHWQALSPMAHDYTVFVHLRHPEGETVAQADHRPLGNLYPTALWPVDETIRESSDLILPTDLSPGTYDLWAGMYLLETGQRLPLENDTSGENAVRLGMLTVVK